MLDRAEWPAPKRNPDHCLSLVNRKPLEPAKEEVDRNPRSRSAKLRAAEKIQP
jgi:16S rRNA (cytosine1402-N4)-methyltransferase